MSGVVELAMIGLIVVIFTCLAAVFVGMAVLVWKVILEDINERR